MPLADRIREERKRRGWSQAELARKARVSQAAISRIEDGKVLSPRLPVLEKLATALQIPIDALVQENYQRETGDVLRNDERAQAIFSGYEKLPEDKKAELLDFVEWLQRKEQPGSSEP